MDPETLKPHHSLNFKPSLYRSFSVCGAVPNKPILETLAMITATLAITRIVKIVVIRPLYQAVKGHKVVSEHVL